MLHEVVQGLGQIAVETGMAVVIIRPPLVYGRGVKANFAALMRAVQRGWPLPLGAVHNQHSLVKLTNLLDFIVTCISRPQAANLTFLVNEGQNQSITELVQRLCSNLQVDISKARTLLSWVSVDEGLWQAVVGALHEKTI